jgi:Exo70 exocyst complex subunit C-terminal
MFSPCTSILTQTMTKLGSLVTFRQPVTALLLSLPSSSWNRAAGSDDPSLVLSRWTTDVLSTLVTTLDTKSRSLLRPRSAFASNLFLLNNLSEAEKRVRADRTLQTVIGVLSATEKETKRGSMIEVAGQAGFVMPKAFEKVKRAGLDGIFRVDVG